MTIRGGKNGGHAFPGNSQNMRSSKNYYPRTVRAKSNEEKE